MKNEKGQAMILISVMLGGLVLSATAIAGMLMYFTLQQSSDSISSAAALFAADAGVEQGLYCYFYKLQGSNLAPCQNQPVLLGNGATATSTIAYDSATGMITATGIGHAGRTGRVLQTTISAQ
jgi:hypothetical protein